MKYIVNLFFVFALFFQTGCATTAGSFVDSSDTQQSQTQQVTDTEKTPTTSANKNSTNPEQAKPKDAISPATQILGYAAGFAIGYLLSGLFF